MRKDFEAFVKARREEWKTYVEHWKDSADHQAALVLAKIEAASKVYPLVEAGDDLKLFAEACALHFGVLPQYNDGLMERARLELWGPGGSTQTELVPLRGRLVLRKGGAPTRVLLVFFQDPDHG